MAVTFAKTTETYDATDAQREDLIDLIYNISPTETPYLMMAGRGSCSARKHEWQMDRLDAAADNANEEAQAITNTELSAAVPAVRVANYTQISQKSISISGTMEVVNKAGRNSELSYQLAKRAKELKRDMELTCVGNAVANMASVAGSSGTARRAAAVQASFHEDWTTTGVTLPGLNISRGTGGASGGFIEATDLFAIPTDGSPLRPLLESDLKGVIQGAWTNGGDPTVIMRGEDKRLVAAIDVYESDFGTHRIVPNRFQRERDVFAFTPELNTICYLRPFRQHALAKIGDSEERTLLAEWTIKHSNNAGNGIVADVTTS
jgi:hypothetical protein